MNRLLIIGPLPDFKHRLQFGGATVLMNNFIDYLKQEFPSFGFIQTNKFSDIKNKCNHQLKSTLWFGISFFFKIWFYDIIVFNFSDRSVVTKYPLLSKLAKLIGKKIVLHKFGGSLDLCFQDISSKQKNNVIAALNRTDLILLETKGAIIHIKKYLNDNIDILWYPNVRKPSIYKKDPSDFNRKLVFISHISDAKGINDIIEVRKMLPNEYSIDLYGAIKDSKYIDYNWESANIHYHGEVDSKEVPQILSHSLLLLLLTSHREGYPGIIIESMSVGIPVVVSDVGGIPEMITEGREGLMVPFGFPSKLNNAILSIDPKKYEQMSRDACDTFNRDFNSEVVNKRILTKILSL